MTFKMFAIIRPQRTKFYYNRKDKIRAWYCKEKHLLNKLGA